MSFNATLIGQMITFLLLVVFTMKYVWPPIMQAMQDRQKKIAEGLASAERGVREQELAQAKAADMLREAKQQAAAPNTQWEDHDSVWGMLNKEYGL